LARFSERLERVVQEAARGQILDVVLEIAGEVPDVGPGVSRSERVQRLERDFSAETAQLAGRIAALGGEVVGRSWLARTIKARLSADRLSALLDADQITLIDMPSRITRS
jgi:hypothetical protein